MTARQRFRENENAFPSLQSRHQWEESSFKDVLFIFDLLTYSMILSKYACSRIYMYILDNQ